MYIKDFAKRKVWSLNEIKLIKRVCCEGKAEYLTVLACSNRICPFSMQSTVMTSTVMMTRMMFFQPTCKHRKFTNEIALRASLSSGLYPKFLGKEGPVESHSPDLYNALDYLKLFCLDALTSLIVSYRN